MNYPHIGAEAAACSILMLVIGAVLPLGLIIFWKLKTKQPISITVCGAVIFFVFAVILESIFTALLLMIDNPVSRAINGNVWLYCAVGGLLAGLFEETGRFVAFKKFLKKHTDRRTAVSYGIGHGGFETMYILCLTGAQYLMYATMINGGQYGTMVEQLRASNATPEQLEAVEALPEQIASLTYLNILPVILERVSGIMLHVVLSMLVFCAVRKAGKMWLYPVAILLHAAVDFLAGMYQKQIITNLWVVEGILLVCSVVLFVIVYKLVYKKQLAEFEGLFKPLEMDFPMYADRQEQPVDLNK